MIGTAIGLGLLGVIVLALLIGIGVAIWNGWIE